MILKSLTIPLGIEPHLITVSHITVSHLITVSPGFCKIVATLEELHWKLEYFFKSFNSNFSVKHGIRICKNAFFNKEYRVSLTCRDFGFVTATIKPDNCAILLRCRILQKNKFLT